jgi:hypothetical protein
MSVTVELQMQALEDLAKTHPDRINRALDRIAIEWTAIAKLTITDMIYSRPRTPDEYRLTGRLRASIAFSSPNSPGTQTDTMLDGTVISSSVPQTNGAVIVGSNVEYANAVHNGLEGRAPRPFLIERISEVTAFATRVIAEETTP